MPTNPTENIGQPDDNSILSEYDLHRLTILATQTQDEGWLSEKCRYLEDILRTLHSPPHIRGLRRTMSLSLKSDMSQNCRSPPQSARVQHFLVDSGGIYPDSVCQSPPESAGHRQVRQTLYPKPLNRECAPHARHPFLNLILNPNPNP